MVEVEIRTNNSQAAGGLYTCVLIKSLKTVQVKGV